MEHLHRQVTLFCLALSALGQQKFVTKDEDGVEVIISEILKENEVVTDRPTESVSAETTSSEQFTFLPTDVFMAWPEVFPDTTTMTDVKAALCSATAWPAEDPGYFQRCEEPEEEGVTGFIYYGRTTTIETSTSVTITETATSLTTVSTLEAVESTEVGEEGDPEESQQSDDIDNGSENDLLSSYEESTLSESDDKVRSGAVLTLTSTAIEDATVASGEGENVQDEERSDAFGRVCSPRALFWPIAMPAVSLWTNKWVFA